VRLGETAATVDGGVGVFAGVGMEAEVEFTELGVEGRGTFQMERLESGETGSGETGETLMADVGRAEPSEAVVPATVVASR